MPIRSTRGRTPAIAAGPSEQGTESMAYSIAAYVIVIGSLVAYGVWVQSQRRQLMREAEVNARNDGDA